jgi:drug/metabolite transporter (DMT)-like permease
VDWILLSLLTALAVASQDAWVKKQFGHLSAHYMLAFPCLYSLPLFAAGLCFIDFPRLDATFFGAFVVSLPLNGIAFFLHMQAIRVSPLSLTVPYLAFTPVFMIFTGVLFLSELPNVWGASGILLVCLGSYILNLDVNHWHLLAPFKAIFKETGSWLMLVVALLYSFAAVIGKKAILHSSPLFFSFTFFIILNLLVLAFMMTFALIQLRTLLGLPCKGLVAGLLLFGHALFHNWAIVLTKAAYMISVKRLSVLFGVIYGGILFKETHFWRRLSGSLLMLAGAVLIILMGR